MKLVKTNLFSKASKAAKTLLCGLMAVAGASMFSSCDMVYEDLEECHQGLQLRFVYDYNMEFADAFYSQVDCLTVLLYNEAGEFVTSRTEDSDILSNPSYRMTFDGLPGGRYTVVAYGGMACDKSSFHFLQEPAEGSQLRDNRVEINSDCLTSPVGTELHPLFYGILENFDVPADWHRYAEQTVYMKKDTNNLRIVMQQANGEPLDEKTFDFALTDDNLLMNWDNQVIPASPYTFMPWTRGNVNLGQLPDGRTSTVCFAEFSFPRLVTDNRPHLVINRHSDGRNIVDIDLLPYLMVAKSEHYHDMDPQEFLDRKSEWDLIFLLDRNMQWVELQIKVNQWTVRINRAHLSN